MNKNTFKTVKLGKGEANVYNFGEVKLHAYKTNDLISDEVFVVEKNGKAVIIESPCFFDNNRELEKYLERFSVVSRGGRYVFAQFTQICHTERRRLFRKWRGKSTY